MHVPLICLKSTIAQVEKEQIKIVKDWIRSYKYNAGDLYSHSAVITRIQPINYLCKIDMEAAGISVS